MKWAKMVDKQGLVMPSSGSIESIYSNNLSKIDKNDGEQVNAAVNIQCISAK